jgi:hypothetical protein
MFFLTDYFSSLDTTPPGKAMLIKIRNVSLKNFVLRLLMKDDMLPVDGGQCFKPKVNILMEIFRKIHTGHRIFK